MNPGLPKRGKSFYEQPFVKLFCDLTWLSRANRSLRDLHPLLLFRPATPCISHLKPMIALVRLDVCTHLLSAGLQFDQPHAACAFRPDVSGGHTPHLKIGCRTSNQDFPRACPLQTVCACVVILTDRSSLPAKPLGGLRRLQLCTFGYHAVLQIAPQRNREAACDRDDRDPSGAAIRGRALRALVEPAGQRAVGLIA